MNWIADNLSLLCLIVLAVVVGLAIYASSRGLSSSEIKRRRRGGK